MKSGHRSFKLFHWRLTVFYGDNAMRWAVNLWTRTFGYICFRPSTYTVCAGKRYWNRWYFYTSPNATPWASTFAIGPGVEPKDKHSAPIRRKAFGFRFDTSWLDNAGGDGEWLPIKGCAR